MSKITEKKLLEFGFTKEIITPEDSGTKMGFYYFVLEINDHCLLISGASDDLIKGGYYVEFFDFIGIKYTDARLVETLVNILKLGVINGKKEKE